MRTLRYAAAGFLLGVAWGVVGRIWMRLISTEPSFSWDGTLLLLGMAGIVGLLLGVIHAARRRGASGWWRLLYLPVPMLFVGAGIPLLPAVIVGGWGLRRRSWARVVAVLAIVSAPVILVVMVWDDVAASLMPYPDNVYRAVLAAGGLVLGGTAAWGSSTALAPWRARPTSVVGSPDQPVAVTA
jgi:hypothetical protein